LQREFTAPRSDLRWVADITEFRCVDGKLYLAGIRDLHDRGLAGWSMGERQTTDLVVAALVMALGRRRPSERLLRQYFPKGTDLARYSREELDAVAFALNTRPRKTLGWKTPAEALDDLLRSA
jgi:transposase InsO family protein